MLVLALALVLVLLVLVLQLFLCPPARGGGGAAARSGADQHAIASLVSWSSGALRGRTGGPAASRKGFKENTPAT